jgi:hypothetical protein
LPAETETIETNWKEKMHIFYHLLVYIDLTSLSIPLRWINFSVRNQSGVELIEVDAQSLRFVMVAYGKVGYNDIGTRTLKAMNMSKK